jgi:hypothetical protein
VLDLGLSKVMFNNEILPNNTSQTGQTVITATITVPDGLFSPLAEVDPCYGSTCQLFSVSTWGWIIDGGPIQTGTPSDFANALTSIVVHIRAFVVNGNAPDTLSDMNGDGVVDAKGQIVGI